MLLPEREDITVVLIADRATSWDVIARRIERRPTTVLREEAACGGRTQHRPAVAQCRAERERFRVRQRVNGGSGGT